MTEAELLSLALAPCLIVPHIRGVSWEKQCNHCSWYDTCLELTLAALPLRCEAVEDDERQMLQEARSIYEQDQDRMVGTVIKGESWN